MQKSTGIVGLLALAVIAIAAVVLVIPRVVTDPQDLRVCYCAARVAIARHDPYLTEPLRSCEQSEASRAGLTEFPKLAMPAPLPGYDIAAFALLSPLSFRAATIAFALILGAAMLASAFLLGRIAALPPLPIVAALALGDGLLAVLNGQIVPLVILALCASAFELKRGRTTAAGLYAVAAAIEPHLALPVLVSLLLSVHRTRVPIALGVGLLAAVAFATLGVRENVEYFTQVIGAQARSEIWGTDQYSLTALLHREGIADDRAVLFGNIQYVAIVFVGVFVARALARRFEAPEFLIFVPPAFALLGGTYIHLVQMAVAIPALFALINRIPKAKNVFAIGILLLAIPWRDTMLNPLPAALAAVAIVTTAIALGIWRTRYSRVVFALAALLTLAAIEHRVADSASSQALPDPSAAIARVASPNRLAEATWEAFVRIRSDANTARFVAENAPTWLGLLLLIGGASLYAFGQKKTRDADVDLLFATP